jgi:hypothetical protein
LKLSLGVSQLKRAKFHDYEMISKSSRLGVGSLIRSQACSASVAVSGDLRRFILQFPYNDPDK